MGKAAVAGKRERKPYKKTGAIHIDVVIKTLDHIEPIRYAAKKAIGPKQLMEEDSPGQDYQKTGGAPADDITVFTQNATSGKMGKYRDIEGFFCPAGGAEARLA